MSEKKERLELIGENIDRLITTDLGMRGSIHLYYPVARKRQGDRPLTLMAAEKLHEAIKPGDTVFIVSGILMSVFTRAVPHLIGETDGPLGSAALGRALQLGLGAKPIFVTDNALIDMMSATSRGAELNVVPLKLLEKAPMGVSVIGFPIDKEEARKEAKRLVSSFEPKAVIAVERRGPNVKGVYHGAWGDNMDLYEAKVGHIFTEAKERNILTIGIGDVCTMEIGMSKVSDVAKKVNPWAANCGCPCGAGIADTTEVDIGMPVAVSNWGGYGIAACLSALLEKLDVFHNGEIEAVMLRECVSAGGVDGLSTTPKLGIDGIPGRIHSSLVDMLLTIVRRGLTSP